MGQALDASRPGAREVVAVVLVAAALALVMHAPLIPRITDSVPGTVPSDPLLVAWQVAWGGDALLHQPGDYFDANAFWPLRDSAAFSDALIGYAPAGFVGSGAKAALIRYNLLYLFAYALAFIGAYLLARELGAGRVGAAVAGVAFAYAPWRWSQVHHLHVISSGGIPLSLFLLVRGYRERRPWMLLAGWVVAAWQVSLGFTLGLQLMYALAILVAGSAIWVAAGRAPRPNRGVVAAGIVGAVLFGSWGILQAMPYFRVVQEHPEARRTVSDVTFFSPPKKAIIAASEHSIPWGTVTGSVRRRLPWPEEQTLFFGGAILSFSFVGLLSSTYRRGLRVILLAAAGVTAAAALGFGLWRGRLYRILYDYAPGWQGIRVPGRLVTLTTLALALLAGAGAAAIVRAARGRMRLPMFAPVLSLLLIAAVLVDGSGHTRTVRVAMPPPGLAGIAAPRMHLPIGPESLYMLWSTSGFAPIVNGYSGFFPREQLQVFEAVRGFPDRASVEMLRSKRVRSVVVHRDLARGTPWADAATRPIDGLGLTRETGRDLVVFTL